MQVVVVQVDTSDDHSDDHCADTVALCAEVSAVPWGAPDGVARVVGRPSLLRLHRRAAGGRCKREHVGDLLDDLGRRLAGTVAGFCVYPDDQRVALPVAAILHELVLQLCGVLERV